MRHALWLVVWQHAGHLPWHKIIDVGTQTVAVCAFLHTVLPPYNWEPEFVTVGLAEFPKGQAAFHAVFNNRYYRLFIYLIGYVALHARSTVWQSISINNPKSPNYNIPVTPPPAPGGD